MFYLRDFNDFIMVQVCTIKTDSRSLGKIAEIGKYIVLERYCSARDHPSCLIFFIHMAFLQILIITPSLLNPSMPIGSQENTINLAPG